MTKNSFSLKSLPDQLKTCVRKSRRYAVISFLALVALLYGFLMFRVSGLSNQQPSGDAVSSQVQSAQIPYIDQSVVKQLQSLQDNSVSVQALFNEARNNPFQE